MAAVSTDARDAHSDDEAERAKPFALDADLKEQWTDDTARLVFST